MGHTVLFSGRPSSGGSEVGGGGGRGEEWRLNPPFLEDYSRQTTKNWMIETE